MKRFVLVLAGCGGGAAVPIVVDVRAIPWVCLITHPRNIKDQELRLPAGRPIKLHVWTPATSGHDTGLEVSIAGITKPVRQGAAVDIDVRFDVPGTHTWKCPTIQAPEDKGDAARPFEVVPAAEYDAFLAANDPDDPANHIVIGKRLTEKKGCVACHTVDGTTRIGPSWKGIWGTQVTLVDGSTRLVDAAYIRRSILAPSEFGRPGFPIGTMPPFEGQLRERELAALVAYIKSLAN